MAAKKSTSATSARPPKPGHQAVPRAPHARQGTRPARNPRFDLGAILGRLADALSIVETVMHAMEAVTFRRK